MDEINKLPLNLRHLITHWLKFLVRHILRPILIHHMVGDWLRWHRLYRLLELRLLHEMMLLLVHLHLLDWNLLNVLNMIVISEILIHILLIVVLNRNMLLLKNLSLILI